jgi:hypothetical protein
VDRVRQSGLLCLGIVIGAVAPVLAILFDQRKEPDG